MGALLRRDHLGCLADHEPLRAELRQRRAHLERCDQRDPRDRVRGRHARAPVGVGAVGELAGRGVAAVRPARVQGADGGRLRQRHARRRARDRLRPAHAGNAGHAHDGGPDVPPGWSYNPSSWPQRAPIIALALRRLLPLPADGRLSARLHPLGLGAVLPSRHPGGPRLETVEELPRSPTPALARSRTWSRR